MATTGTGPASSGIGTTDWDRTAGQQSSGQPGIAETLRETTYRSIDDQKSRASETLGNFAGAVRGMTQPLREGGQPQMADYVNKAADGIERWASQLRQQDLEDAVRAVEQFARRQPAMFLGLAFGAGLVAARFLKSSNPHGNAPSYGGHFEPRPGSGSAALPRSSTTSDIPRMSSDFRPAGEGL